METDNDYRVRVQSRCEEDISLMSGKQLDIMGNIVFCGRKGCSKDYSNEVVELMFGGM